MSLYEVVEAFIERVKVTSDGRLDIALHSGGAICPNTKELEAVHNGVMEMGISSCGWQIYIIPTGSLFAAPVGGMDGRGMRLWYEMGDGFKLWEKATADYNIVTLPGVPVQNFPPELWVFSTVPIISLEDLQGKKMRAMGDGGAILNRLGMSVAFISPSEIYEALMRGVIDMTESTGPSSGVEKGYHEIADYWYFSGSRANSDCGFAWVNKDAWGELPLDLQGILVAELETLGQDDYDTQLFDDMNIIAKLEDFGINVSKLPADIDKALLAEADKYYAEKSTEDPFYKEVYESNKAFQEVYERYIEYSTPAGK
ncbi:Alpha-keto acid-binding periplasmic protein TakP [subsurface metagenome]